MENYKNRIWGFRDQSNTQLTGDLFDPLKEAIAKDPSLKPRFVYFLPPQDTLPENFNSIASAALDVPPVSVFVPEDIDDELYFFHRMAKELPSLLARDASVFISVAHSKVEKVKEVLRKEEYGWPESREWIGRWGEGINSRSVNKRRFYNPSGLFEYEFP